MNIDVPQTPGQRLRFARVHLGETLETFGLPLDRSRAAISRWETDKVDLTALEAGALQHFYGISPDWLLKGVGSMWVAKPERGDPQDTDVIYRPVIPGAASCGPGGEIWDPGPNALRLPFRQGFIDQLLHKCGGKSGDLFVVQASGDSMRPTVHPGDLVLISTNPVMRIQPERDALYLVRSTTDSQDARIKRVRIQDGMIHFVSDANGWKPITVDLRDTPIQSLILGRVCWLGRDVLHDEQPDRNW